MSQEYIKQLEEENAYLRKRLDAAAMGNECYELIMGNLITTNRNASKGIIIYSSSADMHSIRFALSMKMDKNNTYMLKILNDFIEDEKASMGHDKK